MSLPLTEIHAYVSLHQWGPDQIDTLLTVVDRLEEAYFKWYEQFSKKKRNKPARKPKP